MTSDSDRPCAVGDVYLAGDSPAWALPAAGPRHLLVIAAHLAVPAGGATGYAQARLGRWDGAAFAPAHPPQTFFIGLRGGRPDLGAARVGAVNVAPQEEVTP